MNQTEKQREAMIECGARELNDTERFNFHNQGFMYNQAASQIVVDALIRGGYTRAQPAAAGDGWQPIETAPKDGTDILICLADGESKQIDLVRWLPETHHKAKVKGAGWYEPYSFDGKFGDAATHWQPLPQPPAAIGGRDE